MTFDWTAENLQRLRTLWAAGENTRVIGERMGCGKNAAVGKVHRLGLPGRRSPIKPSDVSIDELLRLEATGLRQSEIAKATGLRADHVAERLRRHRAKAGLPPRVRKLTVTLPPMPSVMATPVVHRVAAPPAPKVALPAPKPAPQPRLPSRGCLWPMWAAKGPAYWSAIASGRALECGAPLVSADAPYCRAHRAKGTTSPPRPTTVADRAWPVAHPGDGGRSVEMTTAAHSASR